MKSIRKRLLTLTCILGLGTAAVVAQPRLLAPKLEKGALQVCPVANPVSNRLMAPQRRVVNPDERIFGSYITDEITSPGSGLPTYPGTMQ